jgi:hypothetical protein
MSDLQDSATVTEARDWLREKSAKGDRCPCCRQFVKVYRRKLNAGMAYWLVRFYRLTGGDDGWYDVLRLLPRGAGDWSVLKHWGLIEKHRDHQGYWKITSDGADFARNQITEPSHVILYDDRLLRFDGGETTIREALGKKFDYAELMGERPESGEPE